MYQDIKTMKHVEESQALKSFSMFTYGKMLTPHFFSSFLLDGKYLINRY